MIFLAHRGNLYEPQPKYENTIDYLNLALKEGFGVEVDIIDFENGKFFLGHDKKQESVFPDFLNKINIFAYAKNYKSLSELLKHGIHCFYHINDDNALTS